MKKVIAIVGTVVGIVAVFGALGIRKFVVTRREGV